MSVKWAVKQEMGQVIRLVQTTETLCLIKQRYHVGKLDLNFNFSGAINVSFISFLRGILKEAPKLSTPRRVYFRLIQANPGPPSER